MSYLSAADHLPADRISCIRDSKKRNASRRKRNVSRRLRLAGKLRQIPVAPWLELTSVQLHLIIHKLLGGQRVTLRSGGNVKILRGGTVGIDSQQRYAARLIPQAMGVEMQVRRRRSSGIEHSRSHHLAPQQGRPVVRPGKKGRLIAQSVVSRGQRIVNNHL